MSSTVKYKLDEAVAVVTLNRPDAMNSFNTDLRATVVRYFQQARDDAAVRAIVFTGEGRCFSAGADLKAGIDPDVEKNACSWSIDRYRRSSRRFRNPLSLPCRARQPASVFRSRCSAIY